MTFVSGVGFTNVDLLYSGMPRVPGEGEEVFSSGFSIQLGGGAPAILINLARLGIPCRIQTFLGNDLFSQFAQGQFKDNGILPTNLYHGNSIPLNVTSVMITPNDRTFASYTDAPKITEETMEQVYACSRGAKIVLMQEEFLPIYSRLKRDGAILVYDTGWHDNMSLDRMKEILELADYYLPNRKEAMKITGKNTLKEAAQVLSRWFDQVIIKLDKDGCLLYENGDFTYVPPLKGIRCIDSTGAGDAFLAGFAYGLYHGHSCKQSVQFGNITGGMCVTHVGCLGGNVHEKQLLDISRGI